MVGIELHHASNPSARRALLGYVSNFVALGVELHCTINFVMLRFELCCVVLHYKLYWTTLRSNSITLLCKLLLYNITLHFKLFYATNYTALHYNFIGLCYTTTLLHCIMNSIMLSCEFYYATLCVLLCCVSSFIMLH
jgi:hypothetical protein